MKEDNITKTHKITWQKAMPDGSIRYYIASINRDLFDLIVYCDWGTVGTRRGGNKSYVAKDLDSATKILAQIEKRRASRGYFVV